ncbi:MAG: hypothetical protein AB7V46_25155 [Thermomicrobiales bacterium]
MEGQKQSGFRSRPSALRWFFKKSRDRWKAKFKQLKDAFRAARLELRDVRRSREKWRAKVEELERENQILRDQLQQAQTEESDAPPPPARCRTSR